MAAEEESNPHSLVPADKRSVANRSERLVVRGLELEARLHRRLRFPYDRSMGLLFESDSRGSWDWETLWWPSKKSLGEARGIVTLRREEFLRLRVSPLGATDLSPLANLAAEDLVALDLSCTRVDDTALIHLQGLTGLKRLDLGYTQITDAGLQCLQGMSSLESLCLAGTQITDAGVRYLQELGALKRLVLLNTQITEAGRAKIARALKVYPQPVHPLILQVLDPDGAPKPEMAPALEAMAFDDGEIDEFLVPEWWPYDAWYVWDKMDENAKESVTQERRGAFARAVDMLLPTGAAAGNVTPPDVIAALGEIKSSVSSAEEANRDPDSGWVVGETSYEDLLKFIHVNAFGPVQRRPDLEFSLRLHTYEQWQDWLDRGAGSTVDQNT